MKRTWTYSLALSLGLLATGVQGAEPAPWAPGPRPETAADPAPAVQLGRPTVELGRPVPTLAANPSSYTPAPVAAPAGEFPAPRPPAQFPLVDNRVQPVGWSSDANSNRTIATTGTTDSGIGVRGANVQSGNSMFSWSRNPDDPNSVPGGTPTGEMLPVPRLSPTPYGTGTPLPDGAILPPGATPTGPGGCDNCCGITSDPCCDGCCGGCGCYPGNRFWASAEYLLWWTRGMHLPPLVTTGSAADAIPGALGQRGTAILYGDNDVLGDIRSGGRFAVGYWLTDDHCLGIDAGFFFLGQIDNRFSAFSTGDPILARPFINMTPGSSNFGNEDSQLKAFPNTVAGGVIIREKTELWGAEVNLRTNLCCSCNGNVDLLAGYRIMGLNDSLRINEQITSLLTSTPGSELITDRFTTRNQFNGGQIGISGETHWGRFTFGGWTKVAMGDTFQSVTINGVTTIGGTRTSADGTYNTGILATPSNSGTFSRDKFTVIPEVGLNVGYMLTDHWRVFVGYTFLYWSDVVRAGDQIDRHVDTNQWAPPVAAGSFPAFGFHGTSYWAQGVNFGMEFRW
jgi:hypothetical protein